MPFSIDQLSRGLENAEFVPYFQPIVDLRSGAVHGFEILSRWEHPQRGLISPCVFIPLLERHGLINNLTASILLQAFAAVRGLPGRFRLSVNLSPVQLHDRYLPRLVEIMAEVADFDLTRLTVELTETALVHDLELAGAVADEFKRLGVRLALDDFGTGYSSLLHLQSLPFDELKVDRSFVAAMADARQSRKITAAIVSLGLSLGLQTVAEGIEEQSQADLLVCHGCHFGQGYLFARPVPAAELGAALAFPYGSHGNGAVLPSLADPLLAFDAHPAERLSQLRAIYDGAPVGLAFLDTNLRYVNLNERLAKLNGRRIQAHLGRKVSDVVAPKLYAKYEPYLKRALHGESIPGVEVKWDTDTPEAAARFIMASYQPVRDEAGEILGVCVSVADITAMKQKDEALRESEDHYRHMVELNPQIPWVADATGNIISVSSRWGRLTGLTPEETANHGWLKLVHPDDLGRVTETMHASLNRGELFDVEYRLRAGERWLWVRSRGAPRRDANGNIIRWYGSVESIDEQKRAAEQLRIREARLRAVFDAAPVGLVLADCETGQVLQANRRAEQLVGFQFEPGMLWSSVVWDAYDEHGRPLEESERPLMRAMQLRESTYAARVLLRRADRSLRWLSFTAEPVCLDDGAQLGGVLVIQEAESSNPGDPWTSRMKQRLSHLVAELSVGSPRSSEAATD